MDDFEMGTPEKQKSEVSSKMFSSSSFGKNLNEIEKNKQSNKSGSSQKTSNEKKKTGSTSRSQKIHTIKKKLQIDSIQKQSGQVVKEVNESKEISSTNGNISFEQTHAPKKVVSDMKAIEKESEKPPTPKKEVKISFKSINSNEFGKFVTEQNHINQGKIRGFIKLSCWAGCFWLFLQIIQVALEDKKNKMEINILQNETQKIKKENEHLQSVFLTLIFIFFNALILLLFNEDDKLQNGQKISLNSKTTRSQSVYNPQIKSGAPEKTRKLSDFVSQMNSGTTLRKHFDLIMIALYIITTISTVENIVQSFGNILTINSKILSFVGSLLLLQSNQRQILEFVQFKVKQNSSKREEIIEQMSNEQAMFKFIISFVSQSYMYIRLFSIYDIDLKSQEFNQIHSYMQLMARESLSAKNLVFFIPILIFQQYFVYQQIILVELQRYETLFRLFEALQYEKVWHKTLNTNVSNGIAFYNFQDKVVSVNQKFNDIIGQINKKKLADEKQKVNIMTSIETKLLNNIKSNSYSLMQLSQYFQPESVHIDKSLNLELSQIYVKQRHIDLEKEQARLNKLKKLPSDGKVIQGICINPIQKKESQEIHNSPSCNTPSFSEATQTPQFGQGGAFLESVNSQNDMEHLDTKTQFTLLEIIESLANKKLTYNTVEESNVCYKILYSKQYIQIKTKCHLIQGQPQFVFVIDDLTNLIKFQKQKEAKKQDLLQLASIVHDLKTPLNCIQGTSWIFKSALEQQMPELLPYWKNFDLSFEFIFSMIEDIQDLAKFNNNQKFSLVNEYFEIREFLSDLMTLFKEQSKFKNIELRQIVSENVPQKVFADPKRIKQILMNMMSNALKFTNQGWISVTFELEDLPAQGSIPRKNSSSNMLGSSPKQRSVIKNVRFEENDQVVKSKHVDISLKVSKKLNIIIEDTGVGIKETDLSKLFKYFGKLKDQHNINKKGTGLGLNISKRIVESMGGEIAVESTFGEGTKFSMYVIIQVNQDPKISEYNGPAVRHLNNSMPVMISHERKLGSNSSLIQIEKFKSTNQSMLALGTNYLSGGLFGNNSLDFFVKKKPSIIPTSSPLIIDTIESQLEKIIDRRNSQSNLDSNLSNSCQKLKEKSEEKKKEKIPKISKIPKIPTDQVNLSNITDYDNTNEKTKYLRPSTQMRNIQKQSITNRNLFSFMNETLISTNYHMKTT